MATNSTSFSNTPQASDDEYRFLEDQAAQYGYNSLTNYFTWNVMADDLGGKAKQLFSIYGDDSTSTQELWNALKTKDGSGWEYTEFGRIRIRDGQIDYQLGQGKTDATFVVKDVQSLTAGQLVNDAFTYAIQLGNGTLSYATVTVSITGANDNASISVSGSQDSSVTEAGGIANATPGDASANGKLVVSDVDSGQSTFQAAAPASLVGTYGTFTFNATTGDWTYTLNQTKADPLAAGQNASDKLTVSSVDGTATYDIVVNITGTNDAPAITGTTATLAAGTEDQIYTVTQAQLLAGWSDVDSGDTLSVTGLTVNHGTAVQNPDGSWTITPEANYNGPVTLNYTVTDSHGGNIATSLSFTLAQVNDAGTFGGNTSGNGNEDAGAITGTLTFADAADGFTPNFTVTGAAANGSASIDNAGNWSYTPNANYNGSDSFTVSVTDDDGNVETQVINLSVAQVNDPGTFGGNTSGNGNEDAGAITGTLTFADAADGFTPNFTVSGAAANGSASIDNAGNWSYTPNANYNGSDSFTVSVTDDDGNVETQVISLSVAQVNDPGTFGGNTSGNGNEDAGAITGTLTFADAADGFTPNFTVSGAAANGSASIDNAGNWSYTPNANYNGSDSFTVSVTDDDGNVETQVINLSVAQVNDPGTFGGNTSGNGNEDAGAITGTLTFADAADGFTPNFTVSGAAANGSASIDNAGNWSYTPNANYNGSDSFTVSVTDDDGNVETQVINLSVAQVNDPGTFGGNTSGNGNEDAGAITGTLTFADAADGFTPNFTVSGAAANGSASIDNAGNWSYTPNANYNGSDSFTVSVTDDDGNVETQVINLSVAQVNDPGTFGGNTSGNGNEDAGAITGTLTFADAADGFTPNFTVSGAAANGSASIDNAGNWSYTPNANYNGSDSFTVSVTDDDGNVETQVINLSVAQVNDPGTFGGNTSGNGNEDAGAITGTLTFADAADGFTPNFTVSGAAANGSASIDNAGNWSYTPNANYNGSDSFTVSVTDDDGNVETQVISVGVNPINDLASITGTSTGNVTEDGTLTAGGTLTVTDVDSGENHAHATSSLTGTYGDFTFDSSTGAWGYTLRNGAANVQALNSTDVVHDYLTVLSHDGTANKIIDVTINGANDVVPNQAPTDLSLSQNTIQETALNNTVVGTVTTTDPDNTTPYAYALVDNAGGRFAINASTGVISLARTDLIDFETNSSHNISVKVTDAGGLSYTETFTIQVTDFASVSSTSGTSGNDVIDGTNAANTLSGAQGNDRIFGGAGNDTISGGNNQDALYGQTGDDTLNGDGDNDFVLDGGAGNDILNGGTGNDIMLGGLGQDTMNGDNGADRFIWRAADLGSGVDTINGFAAADTLQIGDLLVGYQAGVSNINDFVKLTASGGNVTVAIDADGTGGNSTFTDLVVINSTTAATVSATLDMTTYTRTDYVG